MNRKTNVKVVTAGIFIATFMSAIEGTIVTTAMPTIVGSLHGIEIFHLFINKCDDYTDLWKIGR